MAITKTFGVGEIALTNTTGTWTYVTSSNVQSFNHTDADDTSIVSIPIPFSNFGPGWQDELKAITVTYTVVTAALDAAPTAVLNRNSWVAATGVKTRAAVTQTLPCRGVDTTGTAAGAGAAGTHTAIVTIADADLLNRTTLRDYLLELTFNAAGTTVLKITGISIDFA